MKKFHQHTGQSVLKLKQHQGDILIPLPQIIFETIDIGNKLMFDKFSLKV
jgi:ribosomal 30S subunit maturation factor RimM